MRCVNCGKEIDEKAVICVGCGTKVQKQIIESKSGTALWWWVGFLVPVAGLLIWGICKDTQPLHAKKAGWGAVFGAIAGVVAVVLFYIIWFALMLWMMLGI